MRIFEFCRRRVLWLIPIGVCLLLIAPMAFTQRTFVPDWTDHVWLVWQQKLNIQDLGHPSYFIQSRELGAFYPFFAFYGATLYVVAGLLALPLGSINAVIVLYFAAFLTAYCGWTWLSIQAGLTGFAAYLPGRDRRHRPLRDHQRVWPRGLRGDGRHLDDPPDPGERAEHLPRRPAQSRAGRRLRLLRRDPDRQPHLDPALGIDLPARSGGDRGARLVRAGSRRGPQAGATRRPVTARARHEPLVPHPAGRIFKGHRDRRETGGASLGNAYTAIGELFRPFRSTPQVGSADVQAQLPVVALVCAAVLLGLAWRGLSRERRRLAVGLAVLLGLVVLLVTTPLADRAPASLLALSPVPLPLGHVRRPARGRSPRAGPRRPEGPSALVSARDGRGRSHCRARDRPGGGAGLRDVLVAHDHPIATRRIRATPSSWVRTGPPAPGTRPRTSAAPPSRPRGRPRFTRSPCPYRPPAAPATS